jgi:hypothetical protein
MLAPHSSIVTPIHPRAAIHPDGSVEGYASLFGEIDQARDMVMPGAFTQSLRLRGVRRIPKCCSSTTRPSRSGYGRTSSRTGAACGCAGGLFPM